MRKEREDINKKEKSTVSRLPTLRIASMLLHSENTVYVVRFAHPIALLRSATLHALGTLYIITHHTLVGEGERP